MRKRFIAFALFAAAGIGSGFTWYPTQFGGGGAPQTLSSIVLSNATTTTGLSSGTAVGILSVSMSPTTPIFAGYSSAGLSLTPTVGGCSGADNASFQIVNDTLETNGAITAGTKNICVAATQAGATGSPLKQNFAITVGTLYDAAATYCASNGGGSGTTGSPWTDQCIQAAINAASNGDTVFLAAGNWALNMSTATPTGNISTSSNPNKITGMSSTAGITVGEIVTDATAGAGNIAIPDYTPPTTVTAINSGCSNCVTLSQNVTATRTGDTFSFGWGIRTGTKSINLVGAGSGNTFDYLGHPNNGSGGPSGTNTRVFSNGTSPANGAAGGYLSFGNYDSLGTFGCNNGSPVATVSHIYFDGSIAQSSRNEGGFSEAGDFNGTFNLQSCPNATVNDIRYVGFNGPNAQFFVRDTNNFTLLNSVDAMPASGGFYAQGETIQYQEFHDGLIKNNIFVAETPNNIDVDNMTFTGNLVYYGCDNVACSVAAAGYGWAGCGLGFCYAGGGTSEPDGSHHFFNTNNYFSMSNTGSGGTASDNNTAIAPGVNDPATNGITNDMEFTGNWLKGADAFLSSCAWRGGIDGESCGPSGVSASPGMQVNNLVFTNNSVIGSSSANIDFRGNGCPDPSSTDNVGTGPADCPANTLNDMQCVSCSATQNYFSAPTAQYLTDSNTVTPTENTNFCASGTFSGCHTTGFTTLPTASFTLNPLGLGSVVPFNTTTFTAQYGAVKWLASTSSTTPTSGGQSGTGNAWSFLPPVSLSATHGDTVYLWTMDSANNISAATSNLVP